MFCIKRKPRPPVDSTRKPAEPITRPPGITPDTPMPLDIIIGEVRVGRQPNSSKEFYSVSAPVILSNPISFSAQWTVDGREVQKEIISYDHLGNPKVVEAIFRATPKSRPYVIKQTSPSLTDPGSLQSPFNIKAKIELSGVIYETHFSQSRPVVLKTGGLCKATKVFSQFFHPTDGSKIMGCHVYIECYREGYAVSLRFSNAVIQKTGAGFNGEVYFDRLTVEIDDKTHVIAESLGQGQKHLFLPMYQMHRRFQSGEMPSYGETLGTSGYHGGNGFGAEQEKLPVFTSDYRLPGTTLTGMEAIKEQCRNKRDRMLGAMAAGVSNVSVDLMTNALGPFMPLYLGDTGSGAPGGWGVSPVEGLGQCDEQIELNYLQHQCMMDRTSTKVYDPDGNYITAYDFASVNNGNQPFYHSIVGGWKTDWATGMENIIHEQVDAPPYFKAYMGKSFNIGNCPYVGTQYSGLLGYKYIDDAHYSRCTRFAKALVYLANDPLAKDDLIEMGHFTHYSWGEIPHSLLWNGQGDHSIWKLKQVFQDITKHHKGWYIERSFGWAADAISQSYAVNKNHADRAKFLNWFKDMADVMSKIQMPNGLLERQAGGINGSQAAKAAIAGEGFPIDQDITGSIYVGIVCQGLYAAMKAALGTEEKIVKILDETICMLFDHSGYPNGPGRYQSPAPIGGAPYPVIQHVKGFEPFNFWWAAIYAFRATGKIEHLNKLMRYATIKNTHDEKLKDFMINKPAWFENAAYYMAEIENRVRFEN